MSTVSDRRARVGAAVDRAWGESFALSPRCMPEGDQGARYSPDASRTGFNFVGRLTSAAQDLHARSRATSVQTTRPTSTANPAVTVQRAALLGVVQAGDLVTAQTGDLTGKAFVVGKFSDGDFGRVVLHLRPASA